MAIMRLRFAISTTTPSTPHTGSLLYSGLLRYSLQIVKFPNQDQRQRDYVLPLPLEGLAADLHPLLQLFQWQCFLAREVLQQNWIIGQNPRHFKGPLSGVLVLRGPFHQIRKGDPIVAEELVQAENFFPPLLRFQLDLESRDCLLRFNLFDDAVFVILRLKAREGELPPDA